MYSEYRRDGVVFRFGVLLRKQLLVKQLLCPVRLLLFHQQHVFGNGLFLQQPHELKHLRSPTGLCVDGDFPSRVQRYRHSVYFPHRLVQLFLGARVFVDRGADRHMHRYILFLQQPLELDDLCRADRLRLGYGQPAVQWHANHVC